ncbi:hypothetical protein HKD37_20G057128 [Glycine soja]
MSQMQRRVLEQRMEEHMWKKQKSHDKASGPKFGQIIPPNSKDINGSGKHDSFPTMSKGNGLKEAVGWEEQCSEQQEIRVSAITPNFTTCEQIKGAMNWAMAKSLGVTCHIQEGKIIYPVHLGDEFFISLRNPVEILHFGLGPEAFFGSRLLVLRQIVQKSEIESLEQEAMGDTHKKLSRIERELNLLETNGDERQLSDHELKLNGIHNMLRGLPADGCWIEEPNGIKEERFEETEGVRPRLDEVRFQRFYEKEVKDAVWECGSEKCPKSDGLKNFGTLSNLLCSIFWMNSMLMEDF